MAKNIMIQGTMSNVGKSILCAALCRIFRQDGYKTAPFKSQNMALNSFITRDGREMGRAQVVQAEAAGIEPDVRMNPILLKPTTDVGSQVIVNGKVQGNMNAMAYFRKKSDYIPVIKKAYDSLASEYEIIVIEGAGSPAEINLKQNDIVNMGLAQIVDAPVLLVGDIDRGGVFAQLYGTMALLETSERQRIKGTIINKFRGDLSVLEPGISMLEELCKVPVAGVIPYLHLDIDDEDSLSEKFERRKNGILDIVVIKLPRISNFTDFDALARCEDVGLRYVEYPNELDDPDMIIIPGTKNTVEDMLHIRQNGIETMIKRYAAKGKPVFGICGGFQMMGETVSDEYGDERKGEFRGMGLLPVRTVFEKEKTRTRVNGIVKNAEGIFSSLNGKNFRGYEIHSGISTLTENFENMNLLEYGTEKKNDGISRGNLYGTYVHGFFDDTAADIVSALLKEKGIGDKKIFCINHDEYKDMQYNKLADGVRENIDLDMIYDIMKRGI